MLPDVYEPLLAHVEKPGRYVGGEINAVTKDPATVRASIALVFPDLYDVGMSYHGFRILYERVNRTPDFAAERVYTPWPDFGDALRAAHLPLTTLETYRPLAELEVIGFTLQHELCYTNILETLDLAQIPIRSRDRAAAFPLVIAGGEGAYSPEPIAEFIDAFVVGDGEEVILDILAAAAEAKEKALSRAELLRAIARIPGVYVPALYDVSYNPEGTVAAIRPNDPAAPAIVRPRQFDITQDSGSVRPVVPVIRTVQDRTVVEVRRGCVNGCRFCQAGMITRPVRERSVQQVLDIVRENLANTGDDGVSLLSLSTADYTELRPLITQLNTELIPRRISVALPSLRISSFDVELAQEVSAVRKSGFTFAPEAGSERLRRTINKPLDEADFLDIIEKVLQAGWRTIKMYFMLGLPGETDEDLDGIVNIVRRAIDGTRALQLRGIMINVTLSPFVPKAHTPFQWEGQASRDEIRRRMNYIRDHMPQKGVGIKTSPIDSSVLEGTFARGDRRLSAVIEHAWREGCRFDGWGEQFRRDTWWAAFAACGIDPAFYTERVRPDDEVFPFDHIESGPGKNYLAMQRDKSRAGETTADCVNNPCSGCDACAKPKDHVLARDAKPADQEIGVPGEKHTLARDAKAQSSQSLPSPGSGLQPSPPSLVNPQSAIPNPQSSPALPIMRVRLRFTKSGPLRFVGHLDMMEAIHRVLRRTSAPLAYSHGFNPQPQISLSPPLTLGFEGAGELADVFLLKRIDIRQWLREITSMPIGGLEWIGAEEVPLKAPSMQQAIARYDYEIAWRAWGEAALEPATLPLDPAALAAAIDHFMKSETWPIEVIRKEKPQQRDARAFVLDCRVAPPPAPFAQTLRMTIRSENGVTLSPLAILEGIFKGKPDAGVVLHVTRLPLEV